MRPSSPIAPPSHKQFRVIFAWYDHPTFVDVVQQAWAGGEPIVFECMASFQVRVAHWNHNVFGNIFHRKKFCLARLDGIRRTFSERGSSRYLLELEQ